MLTNYYKSFIIASVKKVLAQDLVQIEPETPGGPMVAPPDAPIFPEEVMRKLEAYREKALLITDFEGFIKLIEITIAELKLNPAQDNSKVASIFNLFRKENNLEPL